MPLHTKSKLRVVPFVAVILGYSHRARTTSTKKYFRDPQRDASPQHQRNPAMNKFAQWRRHRMTFRDPYYVGSLSAPCARPLCRSRWRQLLHRHPFSRERAPQGAPSVFGCCPCFAASSEWLEKWRDASLLVEIRFCILIFDEPFARMLLISLYRPVICGDVPRIRYFVLKRLSRIIHRGRRITLASIVQVVLL